MAGPTIYADFGNADEDGAVRLTTAGTCEALRREGIRLRDGLEIQLSDGEVIATGVARFRNGIWVAVVQRWGFVDERDF